MKIIQAVRKVGYAGKTPLGILKEVRKEYGEELTVTPSVDLIKKAIKKLKEKDKDVPEENVKKPSRKKKPKKAAAQSPIKDRSLKENQTIKDVSKSLPTSDDVIHFGKDGKLHGTEWMSNMSTCAVYCEYKGDFFTFFCVEQGFQWAKTNSKEFKERIANCLVPSKAKYWGSEKAGCPMREEWTKDKVRLVIMYELMKAKYSQNKVLAEKLLNTGEAELIEVAPWDKEGFWGVNEKGEGKNNSGKLTMKVRKYLAKCKEANKLDYYTADLGKA